MSDDQLAGQLALFNIYEIRHTQTDGLHTRHTKCFYQYVPWSEADRVIDCAMCNMRHFAEGEV